MSSMEFSGLIFLFVMGLNSFKPQFRLFLQNGISRKTHWCGVVLSALVLSLLMTGVFGLMPLVFSSVLGYESMANAFYTGQGALFHLTGMLWQWMMFLLFMSLGFMMTTLYYRMGPKLKLVVSVGVPFALLILLPIVGGLFPQLYLFARIAQMVMWLFGVGLTGAAAFVRSLVMFAGLSVAFLGGAYLLMRRATLKEG